GLETQPRLLRRVLSRIRRDRAAGDEPVSLPTPTSGPPSHGSTGPPPAVPAPSSKTLSIETAPPRPAAGPSPTPAAKPARPARVAHRLTRPAQPERAPGRKLALRPAPVARPSPEPRPSPSPEGRPNPSTAPQTQPGAPTRPLARLSAGRPPQAPASLGVKTQPVPARASATAAPALL